MDILKKVAGARGVSGFLSPFVLQLLCIMFAVEFVKGALIITIIPDYMGGVLGMSALAIGWALSLQYIGDSVLRSPIGWLIDRIGYRWCVLFGVAFTFLSVILLATQQDLRWIIAACVFLGMGTSPLWPAVIAGATESFGDQAKGTLMSVIYLAWLTGIGLGPIVINFFVHDSYDSAFRLLLILMAAVTLVAIFLPGRYKAREARVGKRASAPDKGSNRWTIARVRQYFVNLNASVKVSRWFYVALFAQTFAIGLITPVLTLYARRILHLSSYEYSFFLLFGGAIAVGALIPMGRLVDRYGTSRFLHIGFTISGITLACFTFVEPGWLLYVVIALLGAGYAMIIPAWNALIAEIIPDKERGTVWGFILTIEGLGTISGPVVSGRLWDAIDYHAPFVTSGAVLLLLFVFHIVISIRRKVMLR